MITTTLGDVLRFTDAYPSLVHRKMRPATTLWMLSLVDAMQKHLDNFNTVRRELATSMGAKERPATPEEARLIQSSTVMDIPADRQVEFGKEVAKLHATAVDLFVRPLPFADIGSEAIDAADLMALRPFLELPKGEEHGKSESDGGKAAASSGPANVAQ